MNTKFDEDITYLSTYESLGNIQCSSNEWQSTYEYTLKNRDRDTSRYLYSMFSDLLQR